MNIFTLSNDPVLAAQAQCDKHIVKMPLESAQMLSTAHRVLDGTLVKRPSKSGKRMVNYWDLDSSINDLVYAPAHVKHPCTIWTCETTENYEWHYEHFIALSNEFKHRYGKEHLSFTKLSEFLKNKPKNLKKGSLTPFAQAMPDDVKDSDPVVAYINYYTKYKREIATWNRGRQQPTWWK